MALSVAVDIWINESIFSFCLVIRKIKNQIRHKSTQRSLNEYINVLIM